MTSRNHGSSNSSYHSSNGYVHAPGLKGGDSSALLLNGHINGHSNGHNVQNDSVAVPEMCSYCFDVLECELNNYAPPPMPSFTNDA